ncbi:unnamed protein product [Pleuronectes platessa]|uniref:Uncharacterized protein n=1 Tax=Pleuronectes platessa TaxID=8262 RepID=A0A9N7TQ79_PLEPL|nr:unnamed protein product [Pleuronectes platessa]
MARRRFFFMRNIPLRTREGLEPKVPEETYQYMNTLCGAFEASTHGALRGEVEYLLSVWSNKPWVWVINHTEEGGQTEQAVLYLFCSVKSQSSSMRNHEDLCSPHGGGVHRVHSHKDGFSHSGGRHFWSTNRNRVEQPANQSGLGVVSLKRQELKPSV